MSQNIIDEKQLAKMQKMVADDPVAGAMRHALSKGNLASAAINTERHLDEQFNFSIDIPTMKATNQMQSGRCWLFASCNVMREAIAHKYNIEQFELSQNYLAFYDKLEKVNFMMNSLIELVDKPIDDRVVCWVLQTGIQDGGQWDMMVSVVKKYGIVPKYAMPETAASSNTAYMNQMLDAKIRRFNSDIRRLHQDHKDSRIEPLRAKVLADMYRFLTDCMGKPPVKFDFEYVDRDKKYHCHRNVSPLDFYKDYLGINLDDYISIINAPTDDKPFGKTFTVSYLGNVIGGNPIHYLNLPIKDFKKLVVKQLSDKQVVWFGCDSGKYNNRDLGIWDDQQYDYKTAFGTDFAISKTDALASRNSCMTHAMVFTGVNLTSGRPTKWKIENSWGPDHANDGYHIGSDSWFDLVVYQAVINKKYLSEPQLQMAQQKPIVLNPWDPMGSLAD